MAAQPMQPFEELRFEMGGERLVAFPRIGERADGLAAPVPVALDLRLILADGQPQLAPVERFEAVIDQQEKHHVPGAA